MCECENEIESNFEIISRLFSRHQVCGPIMAKMHGAGNASGGQQSSSHHAGPTRGPTVEEVD